MNTLLILISFFSLTYAIKETSLFDKPRIFLIGLHPFFYKLLSCSYCTGFWSGIILYFIVNYCGKPGEILLWGLASAGVSLIISKWLGK